MRRHAPSNKLGKGGPQTDGASRTSAFHERQNGHIYTNIKSKKKGLLDDHDDNASSLSSSADFICSRRTTNQQSYSEVDRSLLWKAMAILACTLLILVATAISLALSSNRTNSVHPTQNMFPERGKSNGDTSEGSNMWDWAASSWLVNYHPQGEKEETEQTKVETSISGPTNDAEMKSIEHEIPRNLVFVTDRLPGDAKIDPKTLENAAIWQDLYRGSDTNKGYKMHFFPSAESIEKFLDTNAPEYLPAFLQCDNYLEQFDFARFAILYILGGISVDIAVTRPLERLDELFQKVNPLKKKAQLIVSVDYDFETLHDSKVWAYPRQRGFATHVFAATPKHPILKEVADRVSHNLLHRDEVDQAILNHGYPSHVLQDSKKAELLRRSWTTGSGPMSDVILKALIKQTDDEIDDEAHEVIALPMEIFISSHPGGMRFSNIQHSRDHSHIIYMGDAYVEDDDSVDDDTQLLINGDSTLRVTSNAAKKRKQQTSLMKKLLDAGIADTQKHEHGGSPANMQDAYKKKDPYNYGNVVSMDKEGANEDAMPATVRGKNYLVYDESHLPPNTHHSVAPYTYLIGAVRDASQIAETPFQYIVELSCEHGVHVHIVVGGGVAECRERFERAVKSRYSSTQRGKCGRFELLGEPADLHALDNRVDRIAYLRDFQREHLRVVLENGHEDDIIVVADIDLYALPPVKKLMHEVARMRTLHEYDVLCSNGLMHRPNGYYDIYATVLEPDTFVYPIKHRLLGKSWEGEDLNLVRSHDEFGEVTSWDILDWIESEGEKRKVLNTEIANSISAGMKANILWDKAKELGYLANGDIYDFEPSSAVPVRSCFGGLTIYAATALLEPSCRYHPPSVGETADRLLKYANRDDKRPCEHVVFHDCLYRIHTKNGGRSKIAIQPDMKTMWNNMPPPRSKLISDSQQDSLITFYNQADRPDRLTSSNFLHNAYINDDGVLVIESCPIPDCPYPTTRGVSSIKFDRELGIEVRLPKPLDNWSHMFLILEGNGNLILLKQVPKRKLKEGGRNCGLWEDESCQLEVWSSNTNVAGNKQTCDDSMFSFLENEQKLIRYELELKDDGYLEISQWDPDGALRQKDKNVIWRSNGASWIDL